MVALFVFLKVIPDLGLRRDHDVLVDDSPADTAVPPTAAPEATLTAQEAWLKANELGQYASDTQDWAAIEAAAKAEGSVIVYANTSKISKAAEIWAEKYPEIKMEGYDLGGDDVLSKVVAEQESGAFTGDVWFSSGGAELIGTVLPHNYVWRFIPESAAAVGIAIKLAFIDAFRVILFLCAGLAWAGALLAGVLVEAHPAKRKG